MESLITSAEIFLFKKEGQVLSQNNFKSLSRINVFEFEFIFSSITFPLTYSLVLSGIFSRLFGECRYFTFIGRIKNKDNVTIPSIESINDRFFISFI